MAPFSCVKVDHIKLWVSFQRHRYLRPLFAIKTQIKRTMWMARHGGSEPLNQDPIGKSKFRRLTQPRATRPFV